MATQKDDIAELKGDVRLIKQGQAFTNKTVKRIEDSVNKMSYVSKEEYVKDQTAVNTRLDKIDKILDEGAPGRLFAKESFKMFVTGVGVVVGAIIAFILAKVGIK